MEGKGTTITGNETVVDLLAACRHQERQMKGGRLLCHGRRVSYQKGDCCRSVWLRRLLMPLVVVFISLEAPCPGMQKRLEVGTPHSPPLPFLS